jgi:hypothetical protein
MCNVINESRQERRDPWPWSATEARGQLITPHGEVARCGRELLLIALQASAKKCAGGAVRTTSRDTSTDLSCCISGIAGRGGGHNAERCSIKVATISLALRGRHSTVKSANLLDGRNRCARSAPRFKERRHILIISNWKKELAHPPQRVWGIGERIATDRLDARANLGAPLGRECRCDGGKDAELCRELQRACRSCGGKDPLDLCTDSFTREACRQRGIALDCCGGSWLNCQVEARNKPDRTQHAQGIFDEALSRVTDGAQQSVGEVVDTAMWVNDRSVGDWVCAPARTRCETKRDRVDREVSTCKITLNARKEGDLVGTTPVTTVAISTEGGDLTNHRITCRHADGAESILVGGARKECSQLVWRRLGGKVPISRHTSGNHIANCTANDIGAKSCRSQCAQKISDIARNGGANRRRGGHAPLAAVLSEIKRKSRHAE